MSRTRDVLLGRDQEVALITQILSDACNGEAGFLFMSGESGIGKTRLLDELIDIANASGCLTLQARGSEFDHEPFGSFIDALDPYLDTLDQAIVDRLALDAIGALASVFPSLREIDTAIEYPASATERFRVHRAVQELLERLAAQKPVVLVLDDLHWADGASVELIAHLLRHPPRGEVMVACAARPGTWGAASLDVIGGVQSSSFVHTLQLGPLDVDSVGELVRDEEKIDAKSLHDLSGGNPFYALQLARSGVVDASNDSFESLEIPPAVASAISFELASLPPSARDLAAAASVVGDPFDIDLVAATADRDERDVLEGIDVLLARDLVRETDVPRRFQFRHPIVRSAVYSSCRPSSRVLCHRRAAAALADRGTPASGLAGHVEQSARYGDTAAVEVLRQAAEESSTQAPTSAVRWLEAALRIVPADADPVDKADLLRSLAGSQAALGRFEDAHRSLVAGIDLMPPTQIDETTELTVRCAEIEQLLGNHDESRIRLERAYAGLTSPDSRAGVSLLIALAAVSLYLSDQDAILGWGERASKGARHLDDQALIAAALAARTLGAAFSGRIELGLQLHEECTELVDSLPDEVLVRRLDTLSNLAAAETYLDRHLLGCEHGERALMVARASGQTHLLPILTPILGTSLALVGRMRRSAEVLEDAIEAARLVGDAQGLSMNLFNRALAALMAGDLDTATSTGAESVELAHSIDNGVITAFAGAIHAQTLLEIGDADEAIRLLLDSVGGDEIPLLAGGWRAHFFEVLTRCHLALGNEDEARLAAERVRQDVYEQGGGLARLMADRAGAEVALIDRKLDTALELARSAVATAEDIGVIAHVPHCRALLGRTLLGLGEEDKAADEFEKAAREFEFFGATVYRDRVEIQLRRLGRTIHRRSTRAASETTGIGSLTDRELEVAHLVVDRYTNREIAAKLFVSTKTVETHMRNIFNKLGVTSRVEVARSLERAGRQASPTGI